jgi:hypothetical protein
VDSSIGEERGGIEKTTAAGDAERGSERAREQEQERERESKRDRERENAEQSEREREIKRETERGAKRETGTEEVKAETERGSTGEADREKVEREREKIDRWRWEAALQIGRREAQEGHAVILKEPYVMHKARYDRLLGGGADGRQQAKGGARGSKRETGGERETGRQETERQEVGKREQEAVFEDDSLVQSKVTLEAHRGAEVSGVGERVNPGRKGGEGGWSVLEEAERMAGINKHTLRHAFSCPYIGTGTNMRRLSVWQRASSIWPPSVTRSKTSETR